MLRHHLVAKGTAIVVKEVAELIRVSQLLCIQHNAQVDCQFQNSLLMQLLCLHMHTISQVRLNRP